MDDPFDLIPIILALVFLYGFLHIFWVMFDRLRRRWMSANWPVIHAAVMEKGLVDVIRLRYGRKIYRLKVAYHYAVIGTAFEKHIRLDRPSGAQAQAILDKIGPTIEVRYNPEKPDEQISELEQVGRQDAFQLLVMLLGVVMMLVWVRDVFRH